jgi:hypothetical protein
MSGLEIVGVVLGSFPILLNVLDYYRQSLQPLHDFVHFRTRLLAFTDKIRHQRMLYRQNMTELLKPTITRVEDRDALIDNANDPRWSDRSLELLLTGRLGGEEDRFIRIAGEMNDSLKALKKLLGIQEGSVRISYRPEIGLTNTADQLDWEPDPGSVETSSLLFI